MANKVEFEFWVALDFLLLAVGGIVIGTNVFHGKYGAAFFIGVGVFLVGLYYLIKYRFIKKAPKNAIEFSYREGSK